MAEAALSKTQRKNAKKRAAKEKAGDDEPPPTTDPPLEPYYRQIYELSRHVVAQRMALGGESPLEDEEWRQVHMAARAHHRACSASHGDDEAAANGR